MKAIGYAQRMRCPARTFAALGLLAAPGIAEAGDLRDFCADRPGLGTPACIVDKGHVMVELGALDWTRDNGGDGQLDNVTGAQLSIRAGLDDHTELQIGWNGYAAQRLRSPTGAITRIEGGGDLSAGLKWSVARPDGSGASLAIQPFVTLPVGKAGIGAGTWSAGLIVPASIELGHGLAASFAPQIVAEPNGSGRGHHLAWGGVAGLSASLTGRLSASGEVAWTRRNDPAAPGTATTAGLSMAWMASPSLQFDCGANLGLGGTAPERELYLGIARRF